MKDSIKKVEQAIKDFQQGKMIILVDDEDRENEGDIIFPAERITPDVINFMIRYCSGIICLCLPEEKLNQLDLPLMVSESQNNSQHGTGFTVSIEAQEGITTGVSAHDRAQTIKVAVAKNSRAEDLVQPGHIFPLRAKENGLFDRRGHTEGSVDLARLAGYIPAGVLCEVMNEDGSMAKGEQLVAFANTHDLNIISIQDIVNYRLMHEDFIEATTHAQLPIADLGDFTVTVVKDKLNQAEHMVLQKPVTNAQQPTLVRVHSSCITGDLFASLRCDCGDQLRYALQQISEAGGVLIYLQQEGRGIGLFNKIKAYALQEQGLDTVEANNKLGFAADARDYTIAANILQRLKITNLRLMTNNNNKIDCLNAYPNLQVSREAMPVFTNSHNERYIATKQQKLNHIAVE